MGLKCRCGRPTRDRKDKYCPRCTLFELGAVQKSGYLQEVPIDAVWPEDIMTEAGLPNDGSPVKMIQQF